MTFRESSSQAVSAQYDMYWPELSKSCCLIYIVLLLLLSFANQLKVF